MVSSHPGLQFPKRPSRSKGLTARKRIWESLCGRYRVVEAVSLYGGLPTIWYAMYRCDLPACTWDIISQHRAGTPAAESCRKHAQEGGKPKRKGGQDGERRGRRRR